MFTLVQFVPGRSIDQSQTTAAAVQAPQSDAIDCLRNCVGKKISATLVVHVSPDNTDTSNPEIDIAQRCMSTLGAHIGLN